MECLLWTKNEVMYLVMKVKMLVAFVYNVTWKCKILIKRMIVEIPKETLEYLLRWEAPIPKTVAFE